MVSLKKKKNLLLKFKMDLVVVTGRCQTDSPSTAPQSQDPGAAGSPLPVGSGPEAGGWGAAPTPFCQEPGEKKVVLGEELNGKQLDRS